MGGGTIRRGYGAGQCAREWVMYLDRVLRISLALASIAGCTAGAPVSPSTHGPTLGAGASATTETAGPRQSLVADARRIPSGGEIEPGRYFIPKGPWTPATFSFTMPAGWVAQNYGQTFSKHPDESGREVGWGVSIVDRVFADPCGANDTIEVGPTAEDLVAALVALPGLEAGAAVGMTIGGRPGKRLDLTVPADVDVEACDPPIGLQIWLDKAGNKYFLLGPEHPARIYTVDVEGGRFIVVGTSGLNETAAPSDLAELEAIMESIRFEP